MTRITEIIVAQYPGWKSSGATVFFTSRWWNGALVEANSSVLNDINSLSCVSHYMLVAPGKKMIGGRTRISKQKKNTTADELINQSQLTQIGLDEMNALGFNGEGMMVAIFDSGFQGVNLTEPFSSLFTDNRVKMTYNFVNNSAGVYQTHDHGTIVLSVLAANSTGVYTRGATKA